MKFYRRLNTIKAMSFDLDDTLWPLMPPILAAEKALKAWLLEHVPAAAEQYRAGAFNDIRSGLVNGFPERVADVSWLRKELLRRLFVRAELPDNAINRLVDEAFAVFINARCAVTLYDDSESALFSLSRQYRLVAITNGNADVFATPVGALFEFALSPVQPSLAGVAKPDSKIFSHAAERLNMSGSEILHIGDCLNADVGGANAAGWLSALMWRSGDGLPSGHGADVVVRSMAELQALLLGSSCR